MVFRSMVGREDPVDFLRFVVDIMGFLGFENRMNEFFLGLAPTDDTVAARSLELLAGRDIPVCLPTNIKKSYTFMHALPQLFTVHEN